MHAADTSVLVRTTIRAVGARHGLRTSFSPKVDAAGVGNGGHVHLSLGRDERNLMAGGLRAVRADRRGDGVRRRDPRAPAGAARDRRAVGRVVPPAGAAALGRRLRVLGPGEPRGRAADGHRLARAARTWAANLEVKCFDLHANPYLMFAGLLAAGTAGLDGGATLPDPVDVDPASLDEEDAGGPRDQAAARHPARGAGRVRRGRRAGRRRSVSRWSGAIRAVRESELELFDGASPEEVAAASRWAH